MAKPKVDDVAYIILGIVKNSKGKKEFSKSDLKKSACHVLGRNFNKTKSICSTAMSNLLRNGKCVLNEGHIQLGNK